MSHRRLDRVDLFRFRQSYERAGRNSALRYRLIERQYFDLAATIGTVPVSVVALVCPQNENLVAFRGY